MSFLYPTKFFLVLVNKYYAKIGNSKIFINSILDLDLSYIFYLLFYFEIVIFNSRNSTILLEILEIILYKRSYDMPSESSINLNSFLLTSIILGFVSIVAIGCEIYYLVTDLPAVINFNQIGYIFAIGYLFVILFHLSSFILVVIIRLYRKDLTLLNTSFVLILGLISLFFIAVEKVMFDEVGREIYLEWPAPGEVYFIYAGLIINAFYCFTMIIFSLKIFKREKLLGRRERDWFWS